MPDGKTPTGIVCTGACDAVSMTVTLSPPLLVTYTREPSGLATALCGNRPTGMVLTGAFVAVSTTVTEAEPKFVT